MHLSTRGSLGRQHRRAWNAGSVHFGTGYGMNERIVMDSIYLTKKEENEIEANELNI